MRSLVQEEKVGWGIRESKLISGVQREGNDHLNGYDVHLKMGNEYTPKRWTEGVVVSLFKNGGKADPGRFILVNFCVVQDVQ